MEQPPAVGITPAGRELPSVVGVPATWGTAASAAGLSRRKLLRGAGLLGLGFTVPTLLAACGSASNGQTPTSSAGAAAPAAGSQASGSATAARSGGTLTLGIDATSAVNDPTFYTTLGDWMAVDCICRGLTFISFETNDVQPDLAESWDISADGTTYIFHLRKGVTFHDGTAFTSKDVLRSLQRQFTATDPTLLKGAARPLQSISYNLTSMAAVDASTFKMVLKSPDRTLLGQLSDIGGRIVSAAAIEKYGSAIGKHLVGTGPFKFVSATAGQSVVLEAFDGYRLGKPSVDGVILQQVKDASTMISSLISGDISATQFTPYSAKAQLTSSSAVKVADTKYGFDAFVMMDVRAKSLKEIEVRKAINLAIDRKAILAQAFFGVGALPDGYTIPPAQAGYDVSLADLSKQDVAAAKALLVKVGAVGREIKLIAANDTWHPSAAQILQQNLTDIGLKVVTELVDTATYASRLFDPTSAGHELMIWERNSYVPDPNNMIGSLASPNGVYGDFLSGFKTLTGAQYYGTELTRIKNLTAAPARAAAYSALQRKWADEVMVLAMLTCSTNLVTTGAKVTGLNVAALSNHRCFPEGASV